MKNHIVKDALLWGFLLWLIGYILGIILFAIVPPPFIGWIIMPIGIMITLWVLLKKIGSQSLRYYAEIATTWVVLAIALDYILLVRLFNPEDGYYKLAVYLYYALTLTLPLVVGIIKSKSQSNQSQPY